MTAIKTVIIILISLLVILLFWFVKYQLFSNSHKESENIINLKDEMSRKIFNKPLRSCRSFNISDSIGLIQDGLIVCEILSDYPATPIIYYENLPTNFYRCGWFFPNTDCTNISTYENCPGTILCKTKQLYNILHSQRQLPVKNIIYTGFTSIDKYLPEIKKDFSRFIHVAGKSPYKGTASLVRYWLNHPEWPNLTIVCRDEAEQLVNDELRDFKPNNLEIINNYLSDYELKKISNMSGIHICCSENEGFGHYINEARSMASVVLYTDGEPMNEFFTDNVTGFAISCNKSSNIMLAPKYKITEKGLDKAIKKVLITNEKELEEMGRRARMDYLRDDRNFKTKLKSLVTGKRKIPKIMHYVWINKNNPYINVEIPEKNKKYLQTWKTQNPDFKFMFWSGKDIYDLISSKYPQHLEWYKNLPLTISKCDFARMVIVNSIGGVYCDLDFFCRKNIGSLLKGESYFFFEPEEHGNQFLFNGFVASCPDNEFLNGYIDYMARDTIMAKIYSRLIVHKHTGPMALRDYARNTNNMVLIGNTCDISPLNDKGEISSSCKWENWDSYFATVWKDGTGWGSGGINLDPPRFRTIINPINNKPIRWGMEECDLELYKENVRLLLNEYSTVEKDAIIVFANDSKVEIIIPLAHALFENGREDVILLITDFNKKESNLIEKMAILNSLSNIKNKKMN